MLWPFNYWPSHIKLHKQVHDVAWTHRVHSAYNCIGIMLGVAFFILEVGGGITKCFFKCFLKLKIIKDINPWGPLWQIIVENISLCYDQFFELFSAQVWIQEWRHCKCKPSFTTCPVCHVVRYVFQYLSIRAATLQAQTLPLSLNVLILYGDMEQMVKLNVFMFVLLTWTDCSRESIFFKCLKICWVL